ncbi:MAG TPA: hypothetical protein VF070_04815, partial [Streptosporangiaceae bacterium]
MAESVGHGLLGEPDGPGTPGVPHMVDGLTVGPSSGTGPPTGAVSLARCRWIWASVAPSPPIVMSS